MHASEYAVAFCIVCGFMSQSTAILMARRSVPKSTLFFMTSFTKRITSTLCYSFTCNWHPFLNQRNEETIPVQCKHIILGQHRPTSITSFELPFAGGPIVARNWMRAGAVEIISWPISTKVLNRASPESNSRCLDMQSSGVRQILDAFALSGNGTLCFILRLTSSIRSHCSTLASLLEIQ